ncbi:type II toxin-antitoxin system RelE/ParE family toxin [Methylobacterium mesophilicum SR1.6/6]|uniref:Type II toxin-antitoxin system RelE/ParE family toxin n=1 Tax=Methylobacterium mesophilicum SR1.6/6 TaxID=908290 RepID=A0A6B9FPP0_9HYPH|nr:type II toxin-antitoxin system RelE/ParE family toxin [Methylobacterium mesophilicum]QGY04550.1 type II toxin-antitoxin system RelE/ParE family toxin [Methylobacterium mesophilicum SR1.6/6]
MRLRYTRRALRYLHHARAFIGLRDPQAANRVIARIADGVEGLRLHPHRGRPGRIPGTRESVIPGTPDIAAYRIVGDAIEVLAVLHGARQWPGSDP